MQRTLTQPEIDSLIEVLNSLKDYGSTESVSDDLLKKQVVLTQTQIDALIESLLASDLSEQDISLPDRNVVLSQPEIDRLVEALNVMKEYDTAGSFAAEMEKNQRVLTQAEIDRLIEVLSAIKVG